MERYALTRGKVSDWLRPLAHEVRLLAFALTPRTILVLSPYRALASLEHGGKPTHVVHRERGRLTVWHDIYNKGRKAKSLIPQGLIPDLGWNTDQQGKNWQTLPKEKQPEVTVTQTTPTQVEGPPSSRLQSKTNKNKSTDQRDHQDPPECNPTPADPLNAIQEVNQVQTTATASNRMQIVLPLMLIAIILLINVFFYFRL